MNTVVREINGVKGFCFYVKGIPYTYIYTKHAIEMLGLVNLEKGYKKLRINRFGEHFINVIEGNLPEGISQSDCGLNISNNNYAISQDYSDSWTSTGPQKMTNRPTSKYDKIIPEFTLDRVVFAIANKLHNKTAEEFRLQLIWNIIPHFQQTATQDQIAQVPILNQTTQFMYDNNNYTLVTQQAYDFARQILEMHINRYAILLGETDLDKVFSKVAKEYNDILKSEEENDLIYYLKLYLNNIYSITGKKQDANLETIKQTIIMNTRLYSEFITFLIHLIRDTEEIIIRENMNHETLEAYKPTSMSERTLYRAIPEDPTKKQVVRFLNMGEKVGIY